MIVASFIVTSSPNGSLGETLIEGGGSGLGTCAVALVGPKPMVRPKPIVRPKPTTAAAAGSHNMREAIIGISPAGPTRPPRRRSDAYGSVDDRPAPT